MTLFRKLFLCTLLALATAAAHAQEPSFFIERIEVRGTRFTSADVVRRQSLLHEATTYTEPQLKEAIDRVNRLPFVIDADFALEKGTQREQYVLVIRINEAKPLFLDAVDNHFKQQNGDWHESHSQRAGIRGFLGSTMLHASTGPHGVYQAGATQYDLFGTAAFASVGVQWTTRTFATLGGKVKNDPMWNAVVGVPIKGNHSIRATYARQRFTTIFANGFFTTTTKQTSQNASLAWVYDSTDDALFPTSGTIGRAGVQYESTNGVTETGGGFSLPRFTQTAGFADARHWWPFGESQTVMAGVGYSRSHSTSAGLNLINPDVDNYFATAGYSTSLWPRKHTVRIGDLRFETSATASRAAVPPVTFYSANAGVAFRNPWALLHLTFTYTGQRQ